MESTQTTMKARDLVPDASGGTRERKTTLVGDRIVFVEIFHDPDCECPNERDGWSLYSFHPRHTNYKDPESFDQEELERKMAAGLAFRLDYYEHGTSNWSLSEGHHPLGVEYRWDGRRNAGVLVWEGKEDDWARTSAESRLAAAEEFARIYTTWANGECYGYRVVVHTARRTESGELYDRLSDYRFEQELENESVVGYYGRDEVERAAREEIASLLNIPDEQEK